MKSDDLLKKVKTAVKSCDELQGIVCKYKDSRDFAANPVSAFTLCLGMGKTKLTNSADGLDVTCEKEIKLCLLAPSGAGGKRLYEMACWVGEALRNALSVSSIEIGEVKFQGVNNSLYADIVVKVKDSEPYEESFDVYVSGVKMEDLISIEVSNEGYEKTGRLLGGYSLEKKDDVEYLITLKMKVPLFRYGSSFTLAIDYESNRDTYWDCVAVNSKKSYLSSGDVLYSYDLISYRFEESYRGVENGN